jgi:hypothetical protein
MAAADSTRLRALIDSLEVASEEFEKKEEYDSGLLDLVNCITDHQADFVIRALEWKKDEIRWQGDPERGFADVFLRVNRSFLDEKVDAVDRCKKELVALSARKVPTAPLFFLLAEAYLVSNEKLETNAGDEVSAKAALVEERKKLLAQLKQMEESHDRLNKAVADIRDAMAECLPVLEIDSRKDDLEHHLRWLETFLDATNNIENLRIHIEQLEQIVPRTGKPQDNPTAVYLSYFGIVELLKEALGGQQSQSAADLLEVWQVPVKVDTARRWLNRRDTEEPM